MKNLKILCLLIMAILLTACGSSKKPISDDEFKNVMNENDYYVENVLNDFSDYSYIKGAYIAIKNGKNYQIEFYELENNYYAKSFYDINKEIFEASQTNNSIYKNIDLNDTNKYTLINEDSYKVISRIENTVIYVDVNKKYMDDINSILKKLKY